MCTCSNDPLARLSSPDRPATLADAIENGIRLAYQRRRGAIKDVNDVVRLNQPNGSQRAVSVAEVTELARRLVYQAHYVTVLNGEQLILKELARRTFIPEFATILAELTTDVDFAAIVASLAPKDEPAPAA